MLLCVPIEAIYNDYMLSSYELASEKDKKLLKMHSISLIDDFTNYNPNLVYIIDRYIKYNYGTME
jgi:hypothetical protein